MIRTGAATKALVIGAEVFSRILDFNDRTTCVLFGDGAGAVVLEASDEPGILASDLHADGSYVGHPVRAGQRVAAARSLGSAVPADGRPGGVQARGRRARRGRASKRSRRRGMQPTPTSTG